MRALPNSIWDQPRTRSSQEITCQRGVLVLKCLWRLWLFTEEDCRFRLKRRYCHEAAGSSAPQTWKHLWRCSLLHRTQVSSVDPPGRNDPVTVWLTPQRTCGLQCVPVWRLIDRMKTLNVKMTSVRTQGFSGVKRGRQREAFGNVLQRWNARVAFRDNVAVEESRRFCCLAHISVSMVTV